MHDDKARINVSNVHEKRKNLLVLNIPNRRKTLIYLSQLHNFPQKFGHGSSTVMWIAIIHGNI